VKTSVMMNARFSLSGSERGPTGPWQSDDNASLPLRSLQPSNKYNVRELPKNRTISGPHCASSSTNSSARMSYPKFQSIWTPRSVQSPGDRTLPLPSPRGPNFPLVPAPPPASSEGAFHVSLTKSTMVGYSLSDLQVSSPAYAKSSLVYPESSAELTSPEVSSQRSSTDLSTSVSDHKKLRMKVHVLEAQVEKLYNHIDLTRQEATAKDAQYAQIIERSTRLERKSEAELQSWRVDREKWVQEKDHMQKIVMDLRLEIQHLQRSLGILQMPNPVPRRQNEQAVPRTDDEQDYITRHLVIPVEGARDELQRQNPRDEDPCEGLRRESRRLSEHIVEISKIGEVIQQHVDNIGGRE